MCTRTEQQNNTSNIYALISTPSIIHPNAVTFLLLTACQIGGSLHSAEIHWVHARNGTDDDLLVVGVLMDAIEYGTNVEVRASRL